MDGERDGTRRIKVRGVDISRCAGVYWQTMPKSVLFFRGVQNRRQRLVSPPSQLALGRLSSQCPADVADFFRELFERAGLNAEQYRGNALQRRIPACLRFLRVPSLEAARAKMEAQPELLMPTVDVVLLGVTEFFRDPVVFEQLRERVVPTWVGSSAPVRVWSAACSEGQELYSIAMLLLEADISLMQLLGTDCRASAIRAAGEGRFPVAALETVPASWRTHFKKCGNSVRVTDQVRRSVCWKQADLLRSIEPGPWDLILWRNMAIYLNAEASVEVWHAMVRELAPNGYLVSGKADHPPGHSELVSIGRGIYQRRTTR